MSPTIHCCGSLINEKISSVWLWTGGTLTCEPNLLKGFQKNLPPFVFMSARVCEWVPTRTGASRLTDKRGGKATQGNVDVACKQTRMEMTIYRVPKKPVMSIFSNEAISWFSTYRDTPNCKYSSGFLPNYMMSLSWKVKRGESPSLNVSSLNWPFKCPHSPVFLSLSIIFL